MVTHEDVRRISLELPGAFAATDEFRFLVTNKGKPKGFVHLWRERIHPKKSKVSNPDVIVVVVRNLSEKEARIAAAPDKFFTEPHYDGYAAVLVRLNEISLDELKAVLKESWQCVAPDDIKIHEFKESWL